MTLYLVQHAQASSKDVDMRRPLTSKGRRDVRKMAEFIKTLNLKVDFIWHSGKTRAAQTAEALAQAIHVRNRMTARDGLAPNDDAEAIKDELVSTGHDVMIVGHLPFLSKLTSLLLTGTETTGTVAFQNSGIVALERSAEDQWHINWMVIPELLA